MTDKDSGWMGKTIEKTKSLENNNINWQNKDKGWVSYNNY